MSRIVRALSLVLAVTAVSAVAAAGSTAPRLRCPIKPGLPTTGNVQWAFGDDAPAVYVHGHGTWTAGHANGTMCITRGATTVVLAVSGRSQLQTATAGANVVLTLPVSVSQSAEATCTAGTHGTVVLYAHYHVTGIDRAVFHLGGGCSAETHTYGGQLLKMLITRHGSQI